MAKILVIHGPNLNLLGSREPGLYGKVSLPEINQKLTERSSAYKGVKISFLQTNAESEMINAIQKAGQDKVDALILNAGAFAHTSIALRDALLAVKIPCFEVHLTNIWARESFRHNSYLSDISVGVVSGLGPVGYYAALEAAIALLKI